MKALIQRNSRQWITEIDRSGTIYTGVVPKQLSDKIQSKQDVIDWYHQFEKIELSLDEYELVEVVVIDRKELEMLKEKAWKYDELCK